MATQPLPFQIRDAPIDDGDKHLNVRLTSGLGVS